MKDIGSMRLGVLREIKNIRKFFDNMENGVKRRDSESIQFAYVFIKTMVHHMNQGDLTPLSVSLHLELLKSNKGLLNDSRKDSDSDKG